jgi:hypothetical protein
VLRQALEWQMIAVGAEDVEWARAVRLFQVGSEIGYEVAADNAIHMIERDVFGGSGWVKAFAPLWRGVGNDPRQALSDKNALTKLSEWWVSKLLPDPRQSYHALERWMETLASLHQDAADSENTGSMLQLGHMLHYGYVQFASPGAPSVSATGVGAGCGRPRGCLDIDVAQGSALPDTLGAMRWYSDARDLGIRRTKNSIFSIKRRLGIYPCSLAIWIGNIYQYR